MYLLYNTQKDYIYKRKLEIEYPFFNTSYYHYKYLVDVEKRHISLSSGEYISTFKHFKLQF